MKVVLLPEARGDLRAIGDWIARDNPTRAATFVTELEGRAAALADMPERGPIAFTSSRHPVHKLTHGRYLIYYRIRADRVEVLGIHHGARRPPRFD